MNDRTDFAKVSDGPEVVLPSIRPFSRRTLSKPDLLPVRKNGLWGYIDLTGNLVITPRFIFANDFTDGLAAVLPPGPNAKYGFVDRSGGFAILPRYDQVGLGFSEGLADVEIGKKGVSLIRVAPLLCL